MTSWSNFLASATVSAFPVRVHGLFSVPSPVGWTWISHWITRLYFWRFLWCSYPGLVLNSSYILSSASNYKSNKLIRDWKTLSYFVLIEFSFGWTQIWFFRFWFSQIWVWWPFYSSSRIAYGRFRVHLWCFSSVVQWWRQNSQQASKYHFSLFLFRPISSLSEPSPLRSSCSRAESASDIFQCF